MTTYERPEEAALEVSFEWADGPNANAAFKQLSVYNARGFEVKPRMQELARHKSGKWSYSDQRVFVPEGSIIIDRSGNTHGRKETKIWRAVAGRPVLFEFWGSWEEAFLNWPPCPENIRPNVWRNILVNCVPEKARQYWDQNRLTAEI